jgi:hypothetical protein
MSIQNKKWSLNSPKLRLYPSVCLLHSNEQASTWLPAEFLYCFGNVRYSTHGSNWLRGIIFYRYLLPAHFGYCFCQLPNRCGLRIADVENEWRVRGLLLHLQHGIDAVSNVDKIPCLSAIPPHHELSIRIVNRLPYQRGDNLSRPFIFAVFAIGVEYPRNSRPAFLRHSELNLTHQLGPAVASFGVDRIYVLLLENGAKFLLSVGYTETLDA